MVIDSDNDELRSSQCVPDIGHLQAAIARFNTRHDVTEDQQFKALVEELGELSETYNTDSTDGEIAEELSDVIFVARSLAELRDINITDEVAQVTQENLQKDESTDGDKVTKATQNGAAYGVTDD